jgi:CDP-diacylglycerol--glycerol-3-phosphate 3-phosphatidyltransferase
MVDPVADKALVGAALVTLSLLDELPWWATLVVLGRELGVTGLRMLVLRHGLLPATRGGKVKCLTQNVVVVLYLLPLPVALQVIRLPVLLLAVACTVVTGLDYLARAVRLRAGSPAVS